MLTILLFFSELVFLFLLSRSLTRAISYFIHKVTRSKKITVGFIAFLFFPGTLIHELSHYITANMLFVRTYGMELLPKLDGDNLKLGSVSLEKPDFFRHLLIGIAPFFTGTSLMLGTLYYAAQNNLLDKPLFIIIIGYIVFELGNTMFSSKKDMEGAIEFILSLVIIALVFFFVGFRLPQFDINLFFQNGMVKKVFEQGSLFLLIPIGIDIAVIALLKFINK